MLAALPLALGDLASRPVLQILVRSLLVTLAVFAVLGGAAWYGLDTMLQARLEDEGLLSGALATVGTLLALYMLWTAIAFAVVQLFADEVVAAVEARHYPAALAAARPVGFGGEALIGLRSAAFALVVNMIALPFALLFLITGIGTVIVFWFANTLVLGRELELIVWLRHRVPGEARPLSRLARFALGGIAAAMLLVPFVNLLAPVLGAALSTHLFHRRRI